ncbi:MAG: NAD(P)-binding domain-containing protein [Rhizobiales bacterium]|nr:NAD(P)-binding domain-containing protein [Hyphomicrobiales bacterium]
MSAAQTVGIIGVGHLIRHMVPAMVRAPHRFILSERGRETSARLAEQYDLEVVSDNQEIVDNSDIVVLAVRPYDALEVAGSLRWREDQTVLSLCAGTVSSELVPVIEPARMVMAMPVVAAQYGESPTLLYPDDLACRTLLETCGPVVVLDSEDQFAPASVIACYYGWVHELIAQMSDWAAQQGVEPAVARQLVAQMTRAAATSARERIETPLDGLVAELATPRSFTGAGLDVLNEANAFEPWHRAAQHLADGRAS